MGKNGKKRKTLSATIDVKVLESFNEHCDNNAINKSRLIEQFIIKYLEEHQ